VIRLKKAPNDAQFKDQYSGIECTATLKNDRRAEIAVESGSAGRRLDDRWFVDVADDRFALGTPGEHASFEIDGVSTLLHEERRRSS
jgi:hypothetical protein